MKYERAASFEADLRHLTAIERQLFRDAVVRWRRIGDHRIFERP